MGVFSGFGGTGGNDISYGYRLRQWLQDNEDNRKIEQMNAVREAYGPLIDEQLALAQDPERQASLKLMRAGLQAGGGDNLDDVMAMVKQQQHGNVVGSTPTEDMREYGLAQRQGFGGTLQDWIKMQHPAGAPPAALQLASTRASIAGRPMNQDDLEWATKTSGDVAYNVEGGKQRAQTEYAAEKAAQEAQAKKAVDAIDAMPKTIRVYQDHIADADKLMLLADELDKYTQANPTATGAFSDQLAKLPIPNGAKEWANIRDRIKSQLTLETLSNIKQQSPTGATGFGALSESELKVIQDAIANLDQSTSAEQIRKNIQLVREKINDSKRRAADAWNADRKWYMDNRHIAPNLARDIPEYTAPATPQSSGGNGGAWRVVR